MYSAQLPLAMPRTKRGEEEGEKRGIKRERKGERREVEGGV